MAGSKALKVSAVQIRDSQCVRSRGESLCETEHRRRTVVASSGVTLRTQTAPPPFWRSTSPCLRCRPAGRATVCRMADNWGGNRELIRPLPRWRAARLGFSPAPAAITMSLLSSSTMRHYVGGLLCTVAGAWFTEATGSLLPLSLGGAVLVMATFPLVREIRARRTKRPDSR